MTPRSLGRSVVAAGGLALLATPVLACPICFQIEPGAATDGVRAGVLVLLSVTVSVLGGFGWFIRGFVRRAALMSAASATREASEAPVAPTPHPAGARA